VRPGVGVVISPLIALMQDQVDALLAQGVRAAFLNSTQDPQQRREVEDAFLAGELDLLYLAPERLLTVAASHRRDVLWAMEEALRCRAIGAVIGELRHGDIDTVAVRRLSLAAAESGALALLLRARPTSDASTAATRWIVGAAPSPPARGFKFGAPRFAAQLIRNRRGPVGSWILEWSDIDERFVLATPALLVAAPALDRPHRQVA